jgi:hypothetical protein
MDDVDRLLQEAVGSFEPRGDERAVEALVERRRKIRRTIAGVVGVAVFAAAGWFTWAAFRSVESTIGSTEFGTYILSDFEVSERVDPRTEEVDPSQAEVSFTTHWSSNRYPGDHRCEIEVFDASGARIGSLTFEMIALSQGRHLPMTVAVTAPVDGATARGACDAERLDVPVAHVISDEHAVFGRTLEIEYQVRWPDGLPPGGYPGTNACTAALWTDDGLVATAEFTLSVGEGDRAADAGIDPGAVPPRAGPTVACEPFEREGVFPAPEPWAGGPFPELDVLLGADLAAALRVEPHAWSVGSTIEVTDFGVLLDGMLTPDCATTPDLAVIVQQVGDGTFYCAVAETQIEAWILAQRLAGHLPTEAQIEARRVAQPRPRIGGMPEDVDGDGLISDSGLERIPELVLASGEDGTSGYVRYEDLEGPEPSSPEEAAEISGMSRIVPIYAEDGVTIIGRYTISP